MANTLVAALVLVPLTLACAGSGGDVSKREQVARQEASRMQAPTRALSSFAHYELLPATLSDGVRAESDKVAYAEKLEGMLADQIQPLLSQWEQTGGGSGSGTLQVQPEIQGLKIVSGGNRLWLGAMAGSSTIDMNLTLIDAETGDVVAAPRVMRSADAMAGGWSRGATDQNLLYYIADIARLYMVENY
jgi:hypothetical protein